METMKVNTEIEEKMAADTGHEMGCLEWGLEVLLETGTPAKDAYQAWLDGKTNCWCGDQWQG